MKNRAFTLAEVLITLGIIGIVSALVLPSKIEDYQKRKTAIAVKKAYVELNQVLEMSMKDHGDPSTWDYQTAGELVPWVQTYIEPYVKVVKSGTCPGGNQQCLGMNPLQALGYDPK